MKKYPATTFLLATSLFLQVLFTLFPSTMDFFAFNPSAGPFGWIGLITYQVSHGSWSHLIGNFTFGLPFLVFLEGKLGRKKLLEFYFLCGLAAALFNLHLYGPTSCIGSSGSIFGIMVGACLAFGESVQEHLVALAFLLALLLPQLALAPFQAFVGVAFYAHIGGAIGGILLASRLYKV